MKKTKKDAARCDLGEHLGEVHITIAAYNNGFKVEAVSTDPALATLAEWAKETLAAALRVRMNEYERTTTNNHS